MQHTLKRIWHVAREHFTHWIVAGAILAATGAAPEHWLADLFRDVHLPTDALHLWTAGVDLRVVLAGLGLALIAGDIAWRRTRPVAAVESARVAKSASATEPGPAAESGPTATALPLPDKPSLVALPFANLSGDPEQEYFVDGLVEDITTALSRISSLFVIARNSAFTYKGRAVDVRQVSHELGVRYVLEGSVRKTGTRLRITGQLVDATTGAHLWADHFDGGLDDVFDLQDRVTASVSGVIEPRLQRAEIERAQRKPTRDLGAYDYYLRGMDILNQVIPGRFAEAQALFAQAFALDTGYGAAYGMAAFCVNLRKSSAQVPDEGPEIDEGIRLARLAVATGRDDPTALWSGGYVLAYLAYDLDAAAQLIERACALNPNSAIAWNRAGLVKIYLGEYAAGIESLERAMRLSPVDPSLYLAQVGMAFAHFLAERDDAAVAWADRALHERPDWPAALRIKASALAQSGRLEEARRAMAALLRVAPQTRLSSQARTALKIMRRREDSTRFVEGCRLAGMPE